MTKLAWDRAGDKTFQAGLDRGVLYLPDKAVAWNGLTGVEEKFDIEMKPYYQDGVKYLDHQVMGSYAATLKAFTYPSEFEPCIGLASKGSGLIFHDQQPKSFGLSYRTGLGDDLEGLEHGYLIHILYNLRAVPSNIPFSTTDQQTSPVEFSWDITGTPEAAVGRRPTAHVSIKTTDLDFGMIQTIEDILYGTDIDVPYLPSLAELIDTIDNPVEIIDNGDGTWTAIGSANAVSLLSPTVFQVKGIPVNRIDADTYEIETTD
jgi:hypothetical protein